MGIYDGRNIKGFHFIKVFNFNLNTFLFYLNGY